MTTTSARPTSWTPRARGLQCTTRIRRTDFGLAWNVALETGGIAVGDEVSITIDVELLRSNSRRAA